MKIHFYKFHGTGNDFVILDNRKMFFKKDMTDLYQLLCDRHFGIGADGVMLFQEKKDYDFEMVYFNADGRESTMCGNGGRCLVKFAEMMIEKKLQYKFLAIDGEHLAESDGENIRLKMSDVNSASRYLAYYELNTGSPHYVAFVEKVDAVPVKKEGAEIRYSEKFKTEGINVNFVQRNNDGIIMRTYERGVEDETLSCGTGVTAAALMLSNEMNFENGVHTIDVETKGGKLRVEFNKISEQEFIDIWLIGPAVFVFEGQIELPL